MQNNQTAETLDHRKIGSEMGLFTIDPEFVGVGLLLWLPKEMKFEAGYVRVKTTNLAKEKLYLTSGHLPYYASSIFPPMEFKEDGSDDSVFESTWEMTGRYF